MTRTDMNELARKIAQEVLKQLHAAPVLPCVMVIAEHDCGVAEQVRSVLGEEYEYFFVGDDLCGRDPERYVLPQLSCTAMAELVGGGAQDRDTANVLKLLLQGKRVEVLNYEYPAYADTAPNALYSLYKSHVETLKGYGLVPVEVAVPEKVCCREALVTEEVVQRFAGSTTLEVPSTALVTPMAVDAAREIGMTIRKSL